MTDNSELQKQIANYVKTRVIYVEYRKSGYSKKFRAQHESEIMIQQTAKKHFDQLGLTKLPSVKLLREQYAELLTQKRKAYAEYKQAREEMKELYNVKSNVSQLLNIKKSVLNSEGIRVMTPLEWGRLQGFIGYGFLDENGIDHFSFPEGISRAQHINSRHRRFVSICDGVCVNLNFLFQTC